MTPLESRASRIRLVLALGCLAALGPLSLDMYLPSLPALARDLGTSDAVAQLTMSACLIGLAAGQIVIGPLSDRFGRRRPLLIGLAAYVVLCGVCAVAPSAGVLIVARALQGFAGAAGIVLGRAVVRDVYRGRDVARILSILVLISGIAPLVAPLLGGQLLKLFDWRGVFAVLAALGLAIALLAAVAVPETLPRTARHSGGFRAVGAGFGRVLREPLFLGCTITLTLAGAGVFTYISTSSFVLQVGFGLTSEQFSFVFAANSAGVAMLGYLNATLVRRVHPRILLLIGISIAAAGALACVAVAALQLGLWPMLGVLFVTVVSGSFLQPNATALGMTRHARDAGTASAVIGTGPFLVGSALAPLALLGGASALAMSALMALLLVSAWIVVIVFVRPIAARVTDDAAMHAVIDDPVAADPTLPLPPESAPEQPTIADRNTTRRAL